jgi:transposase
VEHVAIDLGGMESQICVRGEDGKILEETRCRTANLEHFLAGRPKSRVIVETCTEAFAVADVAAKLEHEIRVVPATLVRSLGVGSRGIKTDKRDAQILSEVSTRIDLPSVHIPSETSRELKSQCGMREALVECRTKLVNTVRGWLRREATRIPTGAVETFVSRVKRHLEKQGRSMPGHVQRQLAAIDSLTALVVEADAELEEAAKEDETAARLMTAPGVGPVTALRFLAAVDDQRRFPNAHRVESYIGLTPGEDSSSERQRRTSITKAGAPKLRWCLIQAAWNLRRWRRHDPIVLWSLEVEKRRGKRVAVVALARKLAGILYAMWRDKTGYNPLRAADARAPATK